MSAVAVIDLEVAHGRVLEVAVLRLVDGRTDQVFASTVNPNLPGPRCPVAGNQHLHGLGLDQLAHAPSFPEVAPVIWLLTRGSPIVAHNASYDRRHLEAEFAACGLALPNPWIDTLTMARARWPAASSHRLVDLCAMLGLPVVPSHRALPDAWACAALYTALIA